MIRKNVTVVNKQGVHARPASMIAKEAGRFSSQINLITDEMTANGKSIMTIMMMALTHGTDLTIEAVGDDAQLAIESISNLFETGFGEE